MKVGNSNTGWLSPLLLVLMLFGAGVSVQEAGASYRIGSADEEPTFAFDRAALPVPESQTGDADNDRATGDIYNCPGDADAQQPDADGDGVGDVCDDTDNRHGILPQNTAQENRSALRALSGTAKQVALPSGDYLIDNDNDDKLRIDIEGFDGSIVMREGARLVFTEPGDPGLRFSDGVGSRFVGLNVTYQEGKQSRNNAMDALVWKAGPLDECDDVYVENVKVLYSPSAGVLFNLCDRPVVVGADIRQTGADGLHFANSQDARAYNVVTNATGDDGLAFVDYALRPDKDGGYARNVSVSRSATRGIAVIGQDRVTIENFRVYKTFNSGVKIAYEAGYPTRHPDDVLIRDGAVVGAGAYPACGGACSPQRAAIYWLDEASAQDPDTELSNVKVADVRVRNTEVKWACKRGSAPSAPDVRGVTCAAN